MGRKKDEKAYWARINELMVIEGLFHHVSWQMANRMGYIMEGETDLYVENFPQFINLFFEQYDAKAKELEEVRA